MGDGLMEGLRTWAWGCSYGGLAVVHVGKLRAVAGSGLLVLLLQRNGTDVLFVFRHALLRCGLSMDAAVAAV